MRREVQFNSQGSKIRGVLITPEKGPGPFPVVIMGGGWCYVKEIVLPHYAKLMVEAGAACLLMDYRNMGESDCPSPQHIDPWAQVEDFKNAITFAASQSEIDASRIGIWGISYAGGHVVIVGATDPRVKCILSTVPVVEGWETMRRCHGERRFEELQAFVLADRIKRGHGQKGGMMPMSSLTPHEELSVWPFPHVNQIFMKIKSEEAPRHRHENTIESLENLLQYDVSPYARRILNTPTLVVVAEGDNITQWDLEIALFNSIPTTKKELVVLEKMNHMSLYSNRSHLEVASGAHAAFVRRHLVDRASG